ncbi:NAD-dependent epimerase/dehydratase family protein (plasmid) [Mesorhizobium sp. AR02]|uniref:NAD-dependent epimerase/dehydratase family protein n=1 Tax=Mesorhizobium sp. AR02 TaxID=2865837 RepID=UPI00215DF022|nr:NAD-dependent epimerase/dehydratase family protein [Mesorhizobium sp. AR02]UVK57312.1 NAD-dependent epimerase/dehydratase family protein [Mesorhizobium sp. AR02]
MRLSSYSMQDCRHMDTYTTEVRYLVAGGAGFVGTNLARRLLEHGALVDCVDNLSTGRKANVSDLTRYPNFNFIKLDIADTAACDRLLRRRYSHIYNLACPTGVPNIALLGEEMLMASSVGTLNLLKVARRSKASYLFASTAEAYGDPEIFPQPESYVGKVDPVGPRSPYEEGKRFGEALTRFWGRKHNVDVRIVRIFNTYGPAMSPDDQRVIPQMLSRMIAGKPVPIYGDGAQTRTFLHVDDLVDGLMTVMEKGAPAEVYNIGGDTQITICDLFELAKKATGLAGKAAFEKHFIADHRGRCPDTTKVRALGWHPRVSLADGIRHSHRDLVASIQARPQARNGRPADRLPVTGHHHTSTKLYPERRLALS